MIDDEEAVVKKWKGVKIMVRDGSSAKNMEAIFDLSERKKFFENQNGFGLVPSEIMQRRIHSPIFDASIASRSAATET